MKRLQRYAQQFGYARFLSILLLFVLLGVRVADPLPLEELRVRVFDMYQILQPRVTTQRPVVIVDIDEKSLSKLGQWPWPRTRVADLVKQLTNLGAAAIAFDIVFAEPDRLSPALAADTFANLDEETRTKLRTLPSNDQILAEVLRTSPVVLGESGLPRPTPQAELKLPATGLAWKGNDPRSYVLDFPGLLRNIPVLEEAAPGRGLFTIRPALDNIVRRVPMVMLVQGELMSSLTFEMLRIITKADTILIKSDEAGVKSISVPGFEIPTDRNGQLWVHFNRHDPKRFVSAVDVLEGRVGPDAISRKLILIGTSAVGLQDVKTTPLDPAIPGVEVHAQVLESALTRSVLSQPNDAVGYEVLAAVLFGIAIIWLAPVLSAFTLIAFGAVIVSIMVATSWYFYTQHRILIDFTFPLLSSTAIYLVLVFGSYFREQAQRRRIRSAFGQYLSPALVEQLAQSPEKLVLGGEERDMTIMFSDVRGFTSISESFKHDPQGLTSLMNRFLTPLTNAILDRKGTIDKYMGDAIMAFWNAPLSDKEHQINACEAALDMIERIEALNVEREQEAKATGKPFIPMHVGIGLNTGTCVVGNMGSDLRFDYSVLGDAVNLASRLEGQSKSYGVPIIAGSKTALVAKDKFAILELDFITVKGKKEPEVIYAIAGREDVAKSPGFQRLRNLTIEMLSCYRSRNWDGALAAIAKGRTADETNSLKALFDLYSDRIAVFREAPPPDDWDGVFALTTK
ncbi:adenylate cyclase [Nitrobacteraceae bacterium AZCC 1564]